jgi:hypothetical protein
MTRQQDADADIDAQLDKFAENCREIERIERELRAGMIWDAVACALVFGGIGAAFLIPWGAL